MTRDLVFISYSHSDEEVHQWCARLTTALAPTRLSVHLKPWADKDIHPGGLWAQEIDQAVASTKVAVLLVTQNYLASPFIAGRELRPFVEAACRGELTILWAAVGASLYEHTVLAQFQAVNNPKCPLEGLPPADQNTALVELARQIIQAYKSEPRPVPALPEPQPTVPLASIFTASSAPPAAPAAPKPPPIYDRHAELREIEASLDSGARVVVLFGPGGSGKTAVAQAAAATLFGRFPAGAQTIMLDPLPHREQLELHLADHWLGAPARNLPADVRRDEIVARFRGSSGLLVVDNYETLLRTLMADPDNVAAKENARAIGKLFGEMANGDGVILVTTRVFPTWLGKEGRPVRIGPLDRLSSLRLYRDAVRDQWTPDDATLLETLARADEPAAERGHHDVRHEHPTLRLLHTLGFNPLAIQLVGGAVAARVGGRRSVADDLDALLESARDHYLDESDRQASLAASYEYSYLGLPDEAARELFAKLAFFRSAFSASSAATIAERGGDIVALLAALVRNSLVEYRNSGAVEFYVLEPTARWFAQRKAVELTIDFGELSRAIVPQYRALLERFAAASDADTRSTLSAMVPDLLAACDSLDGRERLDYLQQLASALEKLGHLERAIHLYASAAEGWEALGELRPRADALHEIAVIKHRLGLTEAAEDGFRQALALRRESDEVGYAWTLHELGNLDQARGEYTRAREHYTEALELWRKLNRTTGTAWTLHESANLTRAEGWLLKAAAGFEQVIAVWPAAGEGERHRGRAYSLTELGNVLRLTDSTEAAFARYKQALDAWAITGDVYGRTVTLQHSATLLSWLGVFDKALQVLDEAEHLRTEIGDLRGIAACQLERANIWRMQGRYDDARDQFDRADAVYRALHDTPGQATALRGLAGLALMQGHVDAADAGYQRALQTLEEIHSVSGAAYTLHELGVLMVRAGRRKEAQSHFDHAVTRWRPCGDDRGLSATLLYAGALQVHHGDHREGVAMLDESLSLFARLGPTTVIQASVEQIREVVEQAGIPTRTAGLLEAIESRRRAPVWWPA